MSSQLMDRIGCTSPFGINKSEICSDPVEGEAAYSLFEDMNMFNLTEANQTCPKTCKYMMTSFSSS